MTRPVDQNLRALMRAVRAPGDFVRKVLDAEPTAQQAEVLAALENGSSRIAVRSGHGVGKSTLLAWILLWRISTRPYSVIPCTAPTAHQLEDILWGEIARWHRRMREPFRSLLAVGRQRVSHKAAPEAWFAAARTARRESPEALQGFHGKRLCFLIDEASGIPEEVFQVAEGALSTPGSLVVMAGNPTRREGAFYRAFHEDRPHWATFRFPSSQSSLVDPDYARRMAARYGETSDVCRVRVEGEFPASEPDALIGLAPAEAAAARSSAAAPHDAPLVYGVDVARFGDDATVILRRRGPVVTFLESHRHLDTMETAGRVIAAAREEKPAMIFVDSVGLGAGVADRLREEGLPVHAVNVAERARDPERFDDLRSELWWSVREWLDLPEAALPKDDELVAELSTIKYGLTSAGRVRVESKRDRKKRGLGSPDRADALMMTFAAPVVSLDCANAGARNAYKPLDKELGF